MTLRVWLSKSLECLYMIEVIHSKWIDCKMLYLSPIVTTEKESIKDI